MHKYFCLLLLGYISFQSLAQIKGIIQDSTTNEPIPYVNIWIEGQNSGTSADENGNFSLPETDSSKRIVFSAVGYTNKNISVTETSGILYMTPQAIEINEVIIEQRKNNNQITIGSLKNAEKNHFFGNRENHPCMYANFFKYKPEYASAPYLKTIKVITNAEHKGSSFNVRLYSVNKNGEPGDFIYDENILCYPKKGNRTHMIDLSKLNIPFPEDGFFIALEWLIIESNKYEVVIKSTRHDDGTTENLSPKDYDKFYSYTPSFGLTYADPEIISWVYADGKWYKKDKEIHRGGGGLAMELILTN